jgi:hypothetical protein
MGHITLCEGSATFEGRANGEYLVIRFADSDNGIMLSRNHAIRLWQSMKAPIFESFENKAADILTFRTTCAEDTEPRRKAPIEL